jgi:hypothetical protein
MSGAHGGPHENLTPDALSICLEARAWRDCRYAGTKQAHRLSEYTAIASEPVARGGRARTPYRHEPGKIDPKSAPPDGL